ncbi:hypothetical protein OBBRIDRAFT_303340 [Obba rivulosa]|uniref:F-box domain-containing protein n=1 Tax=Obba rivulosa TaxID=1052685 RepID=A0A8E2J2U6_9APHY|nr:hypothetical protein OBBRIDRAFT_303340 [Obba rivulosa]
MVHRRTTLPGGLCLDIWCLIFEAIDDVRGYISCSMTCRILADLVAEIRSHRVLNYPPNSSLKMHRLHCHLRQDPLLGMSLTEVLIPAESLSRFLCMFSGRLYVLRKIRVLGDFIPRTALSLLRSPILAASSRFMHLAKLDISLCCLLEFRQLHRLICAFQSLIELTLNHVSWGRREGRRLADEPFAKFLRLGVIKVSPVVISARMSPIDYTWIYSEDVSQYEDFLSVPNILHSLSQLTLKYWHIQETVNVILETPAARKTDTT